jgi:uncharacterized protein (UPF0332 family)
LIESEYSDPYGEAFNARQLADYVVTIAVDESQARQMLNEANRFVARIAHYLAGLVTS